jgi:DNA modification methylase
MTRAERIPEGRLLRNYEPDLSPIITPEVWQIATAAFSEAHFATFPPALVAPCIMAGCPEGGTVLDPFFGAGTTGLVADRLQRDCIGIELNPEYAELARRRIEGDAGMFSAIEAAA